MRKWKVFMACVLAALLLMGTGLQASAAVRTRLMQEEEEPEAPQGVTLRGRNMVSDGTYLYYVPREPAFTYTNYFGLDYEESEEDALPEARTLRRAALPLADHPQNVEEVLYEGACEWLSIGEDGRLCFCDMDTYAVLCYDPETGETETLCESQYGDAVSLPFIRNGLLYFVEGGDLLCVEPGTDSEASLCFSAWDYSMAEDQEGSSWTWEVADYEFVDDVLYINLRNVDSDYRDIYRLIAGSVPESYDDHVIVTDLEEGTEEDAEEDPSEDEEETEDMDGDSYLASCGFHVVARQNGASIAKYEDELLFVNQIETGDEEEPYLRDSYGVYLFQVSAVDADGEIRTLSDPYDTRTMFVSDGSVYYDGYIEDWAADPEDEETLTGRFIFTETLSADPEEETEAVLFSDQDCPRYIVGVAGGWLWYEFDEDNYWVDVKDINACYWLSYLDEEAEPEDADPAAEEENETEEDGTDDVTPEEIPGETGEYGPGECDLRLTAGDQMAAFRLVRTDGTEECFLILEPGEEKTVTFPSGTYILKLAEGAEWLSDEEAFGADGTYSSTEWFVFEEGYEYYIESDESDGDFDEDTLDGFLN